MERKHKSLTIVAIAVVVILVAGFAIFMQLKDYHDDNSWVGIKVFEGEADPSVTPVPGQEYYQQGEHLPIVFAEVMIDAVNYPDSVMISTDADIIYNGMTLHTALIQSGEQCEIRKGADSVTLVIYDCRFQ